MNLPSRKDGRGPALGMRLGRQQGEDARLLLTPCLLPPPPSPQRGRWSSGAEEGSGPFLHPRGQRARADTQGKSKKQSKTQIQKR